MVENQINVYHSDILPEFRAQFPRKMPWQLPRTSVGMVGTTEFVTD